MLGLALRIGFLRMSGCPLDAFRVIPSVLWRHLRSAAPAIQFFNKFAFEIRSHGIGLLDHRFRFTKQLETATIA
jgi:hypothetical protein